MKSTKILHLTHTDLRYDNRILKELEVLSKVDKYDILAIGVLLQENAAYSEVSINAKIVNINLFSSKLNWLPRWLNYFVLLIELTCKHFFIAYKFKPNIIHCHDTMVLFTGVLLKFFFKCTLIYDAHELESNKNGQNIILSKATKFIEKVCWSKIDYLISVSNSIIKWYNENFTPKDSTLVLNSPVLNYSKKDISKLYFKELYSIENNVLVFIYLGLLGKGRSIETLINVFNEKNINSHIVFVGYGELEDMITYHTTQNVKIHLHKSVPHEKVVEFVQNADVGLCLIETISLSDYYCLPNKLFEYAFAGLPILASNSPEIKAVVNDYFLGKCTEINHDELLNSILQIETEGVNYNPQNLDELSWGTQAERLINLYSKINLNQ